MASGQTTNFGLNQWTAADKVLREEFNRDNVKLDTNLEAIRAACPYVKIKELVTESAVASVNLDVSDVDFTQYLKVELFICAPNCSENIKLQVNNLTSGYYHMQISGGGSGGTNVIQYLALIPPYGYSVLLFYTPYSGSRVGCVNITSNGSSTFSGYQYTAPCTWNELKSFNLTGWEGNIPKGSKFVLLGIRA